MHDDKKSKDDSGKSVDRKPGREQSDVGILKRQYTEDTFPVVRNNLPSPDPKDHDSKDE